MNDFVMRACGLGKKYDLGSRASYAQDGSFSEAMARGAKSLLRSGAANFAPAEFWALRDVSFEVKRGDVVGVIGSNGAGKSTLLKILSRIVEPTVGKVEIAGTVASLLEVGTGFHPELTGRENIYLNGAILGMSRAEIRRKFDEIVSFAEVEKFLDTPVKRYSSGMYVRLAFAVAAHLEPDILVIDEVLAVGDTRFQAKCMGKIDDVAREGRTIFFVSHNMAATEHLCNTAILLDGGRITASGDVAHCINAYRATAGRGNVKTERRTSDEYIVSRIAFAPDNLIEKDPVNFNLEISALSEMNLQDFHFFFTNALGVRAAVLDLRDHGNADGVRRVLAGQTLSLTGVIDRFALVEGAYTVGYTMRTDRHFETVQDVAFLNVRRRSANVASYPAEYNGCASLNYSVSSQLSCSVDTAISV